MISILDIKILQDSGSIASGPHISSHFLHHNVPRRKYVILSNFLATGFYVTRLDACQSELQRKSAMQHGLGGNRILIVHTFNLNNCLVFSFNMLILTVFSGHDKKCRYTKVITKSIWLFPLVTIVSY